MELSCSCYGMELQLRRAKHLVLASLKTGKPVVTANKNLVAAHRIAGQFSRNVAHMSNINCQFILLTSRFLGRRARWRGMCYKA